MNGTPTILAVIFDFDDTLVPDSTTKLIQEHGIDPRRFWTREVKGLVSSGYDPALAYLKLLLDNIGDGRPLGPLTSNDLRDFGASLDGDFYPGIPKVFQDLRAIVKRYKNIEIEFFVVSGGLQDVVEGSKIIKDNFSGVYGCQLAGERDGGVLRHIKRCVTFTEKTRYIFEINKGLDPRKTRRNPFLVNKDIPPPKRRVPFENMIYLGDGLTDIPCFSLLKKLGGTVFGVFNPAEKKSAKRALLEFLKTERVISMHAPRYGKTDELGSLLRAAVAARATKVSLERREAQRTL